MSLADNLLSLSEGFGNHDNALLVQAEESGEHQLNIVAETLVAVSKLLKIAAEEISAVEETTVNEESLETFAQLANVLDASGDEFLQKQAQVIDSFLQAMSSKKALAAFEADEKARQEKLDENYKNPRKELAKLHKLNEVIKKIEASDYYKRDENLGLSTLSMRYCPDHAGCSLAKRSEDNWQCLIDGKIFNWKEGFTTAKGTKVVGKDVAGQSDVMSETPHEIFDTRESRMNRG